MNIKPSTQSNQTCTKNLESLCQNILKNESKFHYFKNKFESLSSSLEQYKLDTSTSFEEIQPEDLVKLQSLDLNTQSIKLLPQNKLVIIWLLNFFILAITLINFIVLPSIHNLKNIIPSYIYLTAFLVMSSIAGLFFRARRDADDKLWSVLSLLMLGFAYLIIRCLFFQIEYFPNQFSTTIWQQPIQLFNLFFSLPNTLILQFFLAIYFVLSIFIFYVSSYLFSGSIEIAKVIKRYPPHLFFNIQTNQEKILRIFDLKKARHTLLSINKFQEKMLVELQNESLLNTLEIDDDQLSNLTEFELFHEKVTFICSIHSDKTKLLTHLHQVQKLMTNSQLLRNQLNELQRQLDDLATQSEGIA